MESQIKGIVINPITCITDERGMVMKMWHPSFAVKDVYATTVRRDAIKAWHGYETKNIFWSVVRGVVKLVMVDMRKNSDTFGVIDELYLGDNSMYSVEVPAGVYNGFKGISVEDSIVVVQADEIYGQIYRLDIDHFGYDWTIKYG